MNRRNFFSTLVKGVGVFSILPPAETYSRIWKAYREVEVYELQYATVPWADLQVAFYALVRKRNQMINEQGLFLPVILDD